MWRHIPDMGAGKSISRSNVRSDNLRCLPFGAPDLRAGEKCLYFSHQLSNLPLARGAETGLPTGDQ